MFQVGRYDPREEDRKKRRRSKGSVSTPKKKSKSKKQRKTKRENVEEGHGDDSDHGSSGHQSPLNRKEDQSISTLRVIAPETEGALSSARKLHTKLNEEAFDDLDLTDELMVEDDKVDEKGDVEIEGRASDLDNGSFDPKDEIQRALHMSKLPIHEAAERWGLAPFLVKNLKEEGHATFFPIQALVIPDVIIAERYSQMRARDVCVAAPTGSGKTLAFVLPVLNALASRKVRRLRALVVLPSRDLAKQVFQVFERYSQGSDLKVGLSIGQSDFRAEQKQLILGDFGASGDARTSCRQMAHLRYALDPGNLESALDAFQEQMDLRGIAPPMPAGGHSAVDVLVCTPGRLVDHCNNTLGFTLQHLRFLVIDEADRLLSQSYHGWIQRVLDGAQAGTRAVAMKAVDKPAPSSPGELSPLLIDPITWRRPETNLMSSADGSSSNPIHRPMQLRRLLYSATLTKDPQKLAALKLVNPKYFNAHHLTEEGRNASSALYSMPKQLQEFTVECTAEQKPLVLLALLLERLRHGDDGGGNSREKKSIIVVFTSSLDSTHRLARLLQLLWSASGYGEPPIEFSSSLNQRQRSAFMKRCNDPSDLVRVVICSDGMSRGMDIGFVSAVINYDVPGFAKTYVHRCGRTARAGKAGEAISLLKGSGQAGQFQKLRRLIDHPQRVEPYKVKTSLVRKAIPLYRSCMGRLKSLLAAEERGELRPMDTDIDEFVP